MSIKINIVVLSGEVTWIKKKFTKDSKVYYNFAIKQPAVEIKEGKVTDRWDEVYYLTCFDNVAMKAGSLRVEDDVTIQGRLTCYTNKDNKIQMGLIAEKIERHGNFASADKESLPWEGDKKDEV